MPSTPPGFSAACMACNASRCQPNIIQLCRLRNVTHQVGRAGRRNARSSRAAPRAWSRSPCRKDPGDRPASILNASTVLLRILARGRIEVRGIEAAVLAQQRRQDLRVPAGTGPDLDDGHVGPDAEKLAGSPADADTDRVRGYRPSDVVKPGPDPVRQRSSRRRGAAWRSRKARRPAWPSALQTSWLSRLAISSLTSRVASSGEDSAIAQGLLRPAQAKSWRRRRWLRRRRTDARTLSCRQRSQWRDPR